MNNRSIRARGNSWPIISVVFVPNRPIQCVFCKRFFDPNNQEERYSATMPMVVENQERRSHLEKSLQCDLGGAGAESVVPDDVSRNELIYPGVDDIVGRPEIFISCCRDHGELLDAVDEKMIVCNGDGTIECLIGMIKDRSVVF